jgi:hypothetical protein
MHAVSMRTLAVIALVATASCEQAVTAPAPSASSANKLILGSPATVNVVRRNTPLATSVSASAVIGLFGGQISIPSAGIKVVIPALALTSPTRITVTAIAGDQVAYEFEPHGTRFLVPLIVTQNLVGTDATNGGLLKPLVAGYFASTSDLDPLGGTGLVSELLGVALNLSSKTATFSVFHFSGYLIASGEGSPFDSFAQ